METSYMKNMVVLKNLPSNLVEEAIVILKSSKRVKELKNLEKLDKFEKSNLFNGEPIKKEKDYILKEAEMLVNSYIDKIEVKHEKKQDIIMKNRKKYMRLKRYAYISSIIIFVQALLLIIK